MLKCLVFDCDGVLLDSVSVKTRAFARIAEPYGEEARDRFVMYHMTHGGVSRYRKFEWLFREILGREITAEESARLGADFAAFALDEVRRCPMIPGAMELLESRRGRMPMYVCSGTPQEELELVLAERGLRPFFADVLGTPPAKAELLIRIVGMAGVLPEEVLMVGDAGTDRQAAEAAGTLFYGVGPEMRGNDIPWGADLTGLDAWISEREARP